MTILEALQILLIEQKFLLKYDIDDEEVVGISSSGEEFVQSEFQENSRTKKAFQELNKNF